MDQTSSLTDVLLMSVDVGGAAGVLLGSLTCLVVVQGHGRDPQVFAVLVLLLS